MKNFINIIIIALFLFCGCNLFCGRNKNKIKQKFYSNEDNEIIINRHLIYEKGNVDYEKSVFFDISLKKDTVLLGDTINGFVNFVNQSNAQQNKFKAYIKCDIDKDKLIGLYPEENQQLVFFNFIPKSKGQQVLKGFIQEDLKTGKVNIITLTVYVIFGK